MSGNIQIGKLRLMDVKSPSGPVVEPPFFPTEIGLFILSLLVVSNPQTNSQRSAL